MYIIALLGFTLLCTGVCFYVAKRRGLNTRFWVVMGLVFGPLAIPFVFMAKPGDPKGGAL